MSEREDTWADINFEISVASENIKHSERTCPTCGAKMTKTPHGYVCPWCGSGPGGGLEQPVEVASS
jgi:Zn finger protein HypA/HybF involved in hydrogenase expression